jgi:signal transduction histidine kinase
VWTRIVAGAAAHEINNLAAGLVNLLAMASRSNGSPESLSRYAALARQQVQGLERLGGDLRALARCEIEVRPQRIDLACEDALVELDVPLDRSVDLDASLTGRVTRASADSLRVAVRATLAHLVLACAPGGVVRVSAASHAGDQIIVAFETDDAAAPLAQVTSAEAALARPGAPLRADLGLVLAGAIAQAMGGELQIGPGQTGGGLRLALRLPAC